MRTLLLFLIVAVSCNSKSDTKQPMGDTAARDTTVASRPPEPAIDENEAIGDLYLSMPATKVVALLGQPAQKKKEELWGADGLLHEQWYYESKGIELNMVRDTAAADKSQSIYSIDVRKPSAYQTRKGIGIGSEYAAAQKAYANQLDTANSHKDLMVVGSLYGGILLEFVDGKVYRIFVGQAAE